MGLFRDIIDEQERFYNEYTAQLVNGNDWPSYRKLMAVGAVTVGVVLVGTVAVGVGISRKIAEDTE